MGKAKDEFEESYHILWFDVQRNPIVRSMYSYRGNKILIICQQYGEENWIAENRLSLSHDNKILLTSSAPSPYEALQKIEGRVYELFGELVILCT